MYTISEIISEKLKKIAIWRYFLLTKYIYMAILIYR
jgi:hypothetical protein